MINAFRSNYTRNYPEIHWKTSYHLLFWQEKTSLQPKKDMKQHTIHNLEHNSREQNIIINEEGYMKGKHDETFWLRSSSISSSVFLWQQVMNETQEWNSWIPCMMQFMRSVSLQKESSLSRGVLFFRTSKTFLSQTLYLETLYSSHAVAILLILRQCFFSPNLMMISFM